MKLDELGISKLQNMSILQCLKVRKSSKKKVLETIKIDYVKIM